MTIKLDNFVERISNYPFQNIEGEIVIVDPRNRLMHQLNEVASRVWDLLSQKHPVRGIIGIIVEEYEVDFSVAQKEITEFLDKMVEQELIQVTHNADK